MRELTHEKKEAWEKKGSEFVRAKKIIVCSSKWRKLVHHYEFNIFRS